MNKLLTSIIATVFVAGAANAATVVNGSFEMDPGVAGNFGGDFSTLPTTDSRTWDVWDGLPGWTVHSGSGIEIQTERTLGFSPQDGDRYVELDSHPGPNSNTTIYQDILFEAGYYELSFWYSPRTTNAGSNGIGFGVDGIFESLVSGPSGVYPRRTWTEVTYHFEVASDTTQRLFFGATGRQDTLGGFIDNVSISEIPVPASALLLLGGLFGLGMMRRKS